MLSGVGRSIATRSCRQGRTPPALAAGQRGVYFIGMRWYSAVGRPDAPFFIFFLL